MTVNIVLAFTRWQELKEIRGCQTDAELAFLLLGQSVIAGLLCFVLFFFSEVFVSDHEYQQQITGSGEAVARGMLC